MASDHPLRRQLHEELHARPSIYFEAPAFARHQAFLMTGPVEAMARRLATLDADITRDGRSGIARAGAGFIKWEIHTEFVSLTHVVAWDGDAGRIPGPDPIWGSLLASMDEPRIVSVEVAVCGGSPEDLSGLLGAGGDPAASGVGGGDGEVWSTFRLNEAGAVRFVLVNHGLNAYRTGRMVRRLLEIETYRMMALLAHPLAGEAFVLCAAFEDRLKAIMQRLGGQKQQQSPLLADITRLSADILDLASRTRDRFGATIAYAELVFKRLGEMRETHIAGHQRIGVFLERRFRPAVRACEQADRRIESAAVRAGRANELLRTAVQVDLDQQNARLLESMEHRVALQVKLQQAVEGFSIIAISYYAVSILKLVLESLGEHAPAVHWLKSYLFAFVPVVVLGVWFAVRRAQAGGHRP